MPEIEEKNEKSTPARGCLSRREFLLASGSVTVVMATGCAGLTLPRGAKLRIVEYPRVRVASLADVKPHQPMVFGYPGEGYQFGSFLVDVDDRAAGGVGPNESIVAFNGSCTHMGGPLSGIYRKEYAVMGPCPLHLTTFDARRHGMVVSGHATESLPQVRLEVVGDDIYATGVMGLIYGLNRNDA
jgi:arsenite oxidase small subunit